MRGRFLISLLLTIPLLIAGGCAQKTVDTDRITVAVSIPPQAEFVGRIGGERVHVLIMVPPGANPHTYEPAPSRLVELNDAIMYVKVGSGIEFELAWLDRIVAVNAEMLVVDSSEGIEFLEETHSVTENHAHGESEHGQAHGKDSESDRGHTHGEDGESDHGHTYGEHDPHVWTSPRNALIMVDNICRGLIAVDPEHGEYYSGRRYAYRAELEELDRTITRIFASKTNRRFITYHPAWGWLARNYGLEQIAIEVEGKEPTARGIERLIAQAKQLGIKSVFVSPQFNTKSAEVIAREIGGAVVHADPLAMNYIENIRTVATALGEAMK